MKQSELEGKTCNGCQARENARNKDTIGFCFHFKLVGNKSASFLLVSAFCKPITERTPELLSAYQEVLFILANSVWGNQTLEN